MCLRVVWQKKAVLHPATIFDTGIHSAGCPIGIDDLFFSGWKQKRLSRPIVFCGNAQNNFPVNWGRLATRCYARNSKMIML